MTLYEQFNSFIKDIGLDLDNIYHEKKEDYEIISFYEEVKNGQVFNVTLVIYNDQDTVEIYIRKQINTSDTLDLYKKINQMNIDYRDMSFFYEESYLVVKSQCTTNGNFEKVIEKMMVNIQVAEKEFENII